jgi:4-amino-4-deoxy-L-arabinose transferase-like glycosyltransferase
VPFGTLLLLCVGLGVIVATYEDYGVTWDESVQARYGELVARYFLSGLRDTAASSYADTRYYGPPFELAAALVCALRPSALWETRHLLVALVALLTVPAVARLGRLLGHPWIGLFGALILLLLPRFYGHAFANSKDVPFACLFSWAMVAICRFAAEPARRRTVLCCGLACGGALALRAGGLGLLAVLGACVVGLAGLARSDWRPRVLGGVAVGAIAWATMVAPWPWAHESPFLNPLRAARVAMSFPAAYPVLFEGQQFSSTALPRYYATKFLLITTPLPVLALAGLGLAVAAAALARRRSAPEAPAQLALLGWLLLPLLAAALTRAPLYDGIRHLLFVLPALALAAGLGATWLVRAVPRGAARGLVATALVLLCLRPLPALVRLHPYQMTYFNELVGGLAGAAGRYETEYWASSYREAIEWVNAQAERRGTPLYILVAANHHSRACAEAYLAPQVRMEVTTSAPPAGALESPFDFYVATTRFGHDRAFPDSSVVHTVGRDGAIFAVVRSRGPAGAPSGGGP